MIKEKTYNLIIELFSKGFTKEEISKKTAINIHTLEHIRVNSLEQIKKTKEEKQKYLELENNLLNLPMYCIIPTLNKINEKDLSKYIKRLIFEQRIDDAIIITSNFSENSVLANQLIDILIEKQEYDKAFLIMHNSKDQKHKVTSIQRIKDCRKINKRLKEKNILELPISKIVEMYNRSSAIIKVILVTRLSESRIDDAITFATMNKDIVKINKQLLNLLYQNKNYQEAYKVAKDLEDFSAMTVIKEKLINKNIEEDTSSNKLYYNLLSQIKNKTITITKLNEEIIEFPPIIKLILTTAASKQKLFTLKNLPNELKKVKNNYEKKTTEYEIVNNLLNITLSSKNTPLDVSIFNNLINKATTIDEKTYQKSKNN